MVWTDYIRFVVALGFVLGLIGVLAWAARRFRLMPLAESARSGGRRRLAVVEVLALDPRRRLVLVRRDDREHLLLLGSERDAVIETGIAAPPEATP